MFTRQEANTLVRAVAQLHAESEAGRSLRHAIMARYNGARLPFPLHMPAMSHARNEASESNDFRNTRDRMLWARDFGCSFADVVMYDIDAEGIIVEEIALHAQGDTCNR